MTQSRFVKHFEIHPDYYADEYDFDFCIVFFDQPLEYNENVQPICLADQDEAVGKVGSMNYVAGWGLTKHEGEISLTLKEAAVPLVKYDECNSIDSYEGLGIQKSPPRWRS